jgi:hypothetical protein
MGHPCNTMHDHAARRLQPTWGGASDSAASSPSRQCACPAPSRSPASGRHNPLPPPITCFDGRQSHCLTQLPGVAVFRAHRCLARPQHSSTSPQ